MRAQYQIKRQFQNEEPEVVFTSTRKADIERFFSRLMKSFKPSEGYAVLHKRLGYAVVYNSAYLTELNRIF